MGSSNPWPWIGGGVAALVAIAVSQGLSKNAESAAPANEPKSVVVEFFAPGNAMQAKVTWTGPEGSETYRGELPLMSTDGSQGVAYNLPAGTAVSITVVNDGSMGSTNLGFAGKVGCRIEADGANIASDNATGFNASVTCTAVTK